MFYLYDSYSSVTYIPQQNDKTVALISQMMTDKLLDKNLNVDNRSNKPERPTKPNRHSFRQSVSMQIQIVLSKLVKSLLLPGILLQSLNLLYVVQLLQ